MYKALAAVAAISIASASVAAPAYAAAPNASSHSQGIAGFVHSLLNFRSNPVPPFPVPPIPTPHALNGVCHILKVDWLISACQAGFPGGGMSPG